MKTIFSPWRSAYIETFSEKKSKTGCLFCELKRNRKNDIRELVLWRGTFCFIVMNRYPYNSGHLMVVPYRHTADFGSFSPDEYKELMSLVQNGIAALKKIVKPHGFNMGMNLGKVAGAGIDKHLHMHLVPRWNGDANFMPVLADVKIVSDSMEKQRDALRKEFQRLLGSSLLFERNESVQRSRSKKRLLLNDPGTSGKLSR